MLTFSGNLKKCNTVSLWISFIKLLLRDKFCGTYYMACGQYVCSFRGGVLVSWTMSTTITQITNNSNFRRLNCLSITIKSCSCMQLCSTSDFCLVIRFVCCRRQRQIHSGETEGGRNEDLLACVWKWNCYIKYWWNILSWSVYVCCMRECLWRVLLKEADAGQAQESGF